VQLALHENPLSTVEAAASLVHSRLRPMLPGALQSSMVFGVASVCGGGGGGGACAHSLYAEC
jgi:hypothetical protein